MASLLGIPVVHDFRSADVRAGGQGAPLSACYHAALLRGAPPGTAVLNLGGVGNLTWMGAGGMDREGWVRTGRVRRGRVRTGR